MGKRKHSERLDKLIDKLFMTLPADSYAQIAERLTVLMGEPITKGVVNDIIRHLREYSKRYQWTIQHVKRGPPHKNGLDCGRFNAFTVNAATGAVERHSNPDACDHADKGNAATMDLAFTQLTHVSAGVRAQASYTASPLLREQCIEMADETIVLARRIRKLAEALRKVG